MANYSGKDGNGVVRFWSSTGTGTEQDPFVPNRGGTTAVSSLPAISGTVAVSSGTISISGGVAISALPALPAGSNAIGSVTVSSGTVSVDSLPALPAGTNNIGDVDVASLPELPEGTNNIGDVDVVSLPALPAGSNSLGSVGLDAGETHIGSVGGNTAVISVTLSLDTAAYADGDVLADSQVVAGATRIDDGTAILDHIVVIDKDDQQIELDLIFLSDNVSLGTENSAPSITDVNAEHILGIVTIDTWTDLGGVAVAVKDRAGVIITPKTGTNDIYVAAVTRGTPTHTASGIVLRLGFLQD